MKESCPSCDSTEGIREILYGMPEFPVDETKYYIKGCCVVPNSPTWLCLECGWAGWSLNNSNGTKLCEFECPVCKSVGKIHLLGQSDHANYLARNKTFKAEMGFGDAQPNGMCLKCGWMAKFIHTYSY
jgi:hypothetical protein